MKLIYIAIVAILANLAQAEVYRWTDADGKVHFSDKKPQTNAEDITAKVNKQNLDTSTEERNKVSQIFRKENDEDRQFYQQQENQRIQERDEKNKRCQDAKAYMKSIKGRVQFIDDAGNPIYVTEQERQQREKQHAIIVQQECSE